jgi:hypothetical protein
VHTIHIGIGSNYNVIVTQPFIPFFNIQCVLQQVELFVLIHHFLRERKTVQRFTAQAEYGLRFHVARFGNGTARRVTFGNKDGAFLGLLQYGFLIAARWLIVQVVAAIA